MRDDKQVESKPRQTDLFHLRYRINLTRKVVYNTHMPLHTSWWIRGRTEDNNPLFHSYMLECYFCLLFCLQQNIPTNK